MASVAGAGPATLTGTSAGLPEVDLRGLGARSSVGGATGTSSLAEFVPGLVSLLSPIISSVSQRAGGASSFAVGDVGGPAGSSIIGSGGVGGPEFWGTGESLEAAATCVQAVPFYIISGTAF